MYTEKVLDHFEHPRNVGALDDANGVGMVGNAKCGDIMQMFLKVNDDGIIEDVGFKTFGCGAAIATSSMATELIKGKSIEEALQLSNSAVRAAIADYYRKKGMEAKAKEVENTKCSCEHEEPHEH